MIALGTNDVREKYTESTQEHITNVIGHLQKRTRGSKILIHVPPLQRYNAEQEAKINQFNTAQNPNRRARTATKERDERIFRIVSRYDGLNLLA